MMTTNTEIRIRNRYLRWDEVQNADVTIAGEGIAGVTGANGAVRLDTTGLNGAFTLEVRPAHASRDPVGPATAGGAARIWRPVDLTVQFTGGRLTAAISNNPLWGRVDAVGPPLEIGLQPVWLESPSHDGRGGATTNLIVIHRTGDDGDNEFNMRTALNTWLNSAENRSIHYVIGDDGQIVKLVQEADRAWHAGKAHWNGSNNVNSLSIGIELARGPNEDYSDPQYTSLIELITRIRNAVPTIPARGIIGHSDVALKNGKLGRKSSDPGLRFQWKKLETEGLGLRPIHPDAATNVGVYGNLFITAGAGVAFQQGDNDDTRTFGGLSGKAVAGVIGDPVEEIQQDLKDIGYWVGNPDGDYGGKTAAAVRMFQEHVFAGGRGGGRTPNGQVDFGTAILIKMYRP